MPDLIVRGSSKTIEVIKQQIFSDPYLRSEKTRVAYLGDLTRFETWRESRPMSVLLVEEYMKSLEHEGKSVASINRALSAIRWWARRMIKMASVFAAPVAQDQMKALAGEIVSMRDIKHERVRPGRPIASREVRDLVNICLKDKTERGIRDAAIVALAFATGLRRGELSALDMDDYISRINRVEILVRESKGEKDRSVPVAEFALNHLEAYLEVRGNDSGPLLYCCKKSGLLIQGKRLMPAGIYYIFETRTKGAGLEGKINPHDARRFAATQFIQTGSITTAASLLGHSSIETTAAYAREDEELKWDTVGKVDGRLSGKKSR